MLSPSNKTEQKSNTPLQNVHNNGGLLRKERDGNKGGIITLYANYSFINQKITLVEDCKNVVRSHKLHRPDRYPDGTIASKTIKQLMFFCPGNNSPGYYHTLLECVRSGEERISEP